MTKEVIVQFRDDVDGKLGASVATRVYTIDGVTYESELSDLNYKRFLKLVKPFTDVARVAKKTRKKPTKKANAKAEPNPDTAAMGQQGQAEIRAWARDNGYDVNQRGSIRQEITDAYREAHGLEEEDG